MKLFLLALCVCAATAELRWDETGKYRLIDDKPLEYRFLEQPITDLRIAPTSALRVIGAPMAESLPFAYRYWDPTMFPSTEARLAAMALRNAQPVIIPINKK